MCCILICGISPKSRACLDIWHSAGGQLDLQNPRILWPRMCLLLLTVLSREVTELDPKLDGWIEWTKNSRFVSKPKWRRRCWLSVLSVCVGAVRQNMRPPTKVDMICSKIWQFAVLFTCFDNEVVVWLLFWFHIRLVHYTTWTYWSWYIANCDFNQI